MLCVRGTLGLFGVGFPCPGLALGIPTALPIAKGRLSRLLTLESGKGQDVHS